MNKERIMNKEKIMIIDFGGQYSQLIARKVREQHVYAEIIPYSKVNAEMIRGEMNGTGSTVCKGIILTGGPNSVYEKGAPRCSKEILETGIPVLGICYGFQLMAYLAGGIIESAKNRSEYGRTELYVNDYDGSETRNVLFKGIPEKSTVWMSHSDFVSCLPDGFKMTAYTEMCPAAAFSNENKKLYGVQFHPEVTHTEFGTALLLNFLFVICGCGGDWKMGDFLENSIRKYREELNERKVILALSGGVDSAVAAVLLHKAVGNDLKCVFVDHGLLRKDEGDRVEKVFKETFKMNLARLNVKDHFLEKLLGVTDPETKRKIIGKEFVRVFEKEAKGQADVLAQGTIYPDVIESGKAASAVIKSHHNVGGLPEHSDFKMIVEPLRNLFKDEVRELGEKLGIPRELLWRQPFPGPGLAVRIIGEVTDRKLEILKEADAIFRDEMKNAGMSETASQYFAVLTGVRTVGVMGDERTYGETIALRAVTTDDFMTAEWAKIPWEVLERVSERITNEVRDVSRVVYDITSKPPSTVEWE